MADSVKIFASYIDNDPYGVKFYCGTSLVPSPGSGQFLYLAPGVFDIRVVSPYASLDLDEVDLSHSYYFQDGDYETEYPASVTIPGEDGKISIWVQDSAEEFYILMDAIGAYTYNMNTIQLIGNGSGSSVVPSSLSIQNGQSYSSLSSVSVSRSGYTFLGWFTDPNGGVQVTPTMGCMITGGQQTLYAHWSQNEIPEVVVDKNLTVYYAPINPSMSPTISGSTWTLQFSKYEPFGDNGYFNAFKVSYNGVDSAIYDLAVYSGAKSVSLTRNGSTLKWGNAVLLTNLPAVTDCSVTFICLCNLSGHEPWVGKTFSLAYSQQGPTTTITDVSIKYPTANQNACTLPSNYTDSNVCLEVSLSGDIASDVAITTKAIKVEFGGDDWTFSTPSGSNFKLKLTNVELHQGENSFTVSIPGTSIPQQTATINCTKLNHDYSEIFKDNVINPQLLKDLIQEVWYCFMNCTKLGEQVSDKLVAMGLMYFAMDSQIDPNNLIIDQYSTENGEGFYQLWKLIAETYDKIIETASIFKTTAGDTESPMKSDDIQFVLDPVLLSNEENRDVLYLYDGRDVNTDELQNQVINSQTELRTDPEYSIGNVETPYDRLIISEPYSSSNITNDQLVVLNNYQQAMLYIIQNIL